MSPQHVQEALGAAEAQAGIEPSAPLSLFALRQYLAQELQSTGGRPALAGAKERKKIPLPEAEWQKLEELAAVLLSLGVRTTPGQVASALLHQSLEQLETLDPKSLAEQLKS
ncbi:MAG: hypothetical protein ACAI44_04160 [Candidatus Sericytochromatia bacterium]